MVNTCLQKTDYLVTSMLCVVPRMQLSGQRDPSFKTLRFPLCAEFWRHCVLSGGTQRRALPRHRSKEMKILNISSSGNQTHELSRLQSDHRCAPVPPLASKLSKSMSCQNIKKNEYLYTYRTQSKSSIRSHKSIFLIPKTNKNLLKRVGYLFTQQYVKILCLNLFSVADAGRSVAP